MLMLDLIVQALATVLLIHGLWLCGDKNPQGPLEAAISEVLWVIIGIVHGVWGLVALSLILAVVQARTYVQWRKG